MKKKSGFEKFKLDSWEFLKNNWFILLILMFVVSFFIINNSAEEIAGIFLSVAAFFLSIFASLINNRKTKKIYIYISIAIFVFGIFLFADKPIKINKDIFSIYFFDNKTKNLLTFNEYPEIKKYYTNEIYVISEYNKNRGKLDITSTDLNKIFDLKAISILNYYMIKHQMTWNMTTLVSNGLGEAWDIDRLNNYNPKNFNEYKIANLPKTLKKNTYFDGLSKYMKLILPKNTIIDYESNTINRNCRLIFKNIYFNTEINIRMRTSGWGLLCINDFLGIRKPGISWKNYVNNGYISDIYGNVVLIIRCKAEFNRFFFGNPELISYKKWVEELFNDIQNENDYGLMEGQLKKHLNYVADCTIIDKIK